MANSGSRRERRQQKKLAKKSGGGQAADIGAVLEGALADQQAGRLDEAEQAYRQALSQDPKAFVAHVNLGVVLHDQGRLEDAAESFDNALAINPDVAEVHYGLGLVLQDRDEKADAEAAFRRAVEINPDYSEALNGLAIALEKQGHREQAAATFERALTADPGFAEAHNNLGNLQHRHGNLEEALAAFRRAIEINPEYAEAHRNLSHVLLLAGRLDEGWKEFRWRWRCRDFPSATRPFPQPPWTGEPVDGKTVLVWGEQGVGDEVHFAAMVPDLIDAGAKVVLECEHRLAPLFGRSFPEAKCVALENPPAAETMGDDIYFQVPSGNLGQWLRPDLDSFPDRVSYLVADEDRVAELKDRYRDGTGDRLVGIAWISKNPEIGKDKSMALADWRPLTEIEGIRFVDLQYGDTADERAEFERETRTLIIHDDAIDQMADVDAFAAQVAAMDLVISVSNTTVHLSGALGVPTWVLLNTLPLCVWMAEGEDSPWYPSLRLIRQSEAGEWADVIGRVVVALEDFRR